MTRVRTLCTAFVLTLAFLFSTAALAEPTAWDQAQVTAIAKDLAKDADTWQQAVRAEPGITLGSGDSEQQFGLLQKAETLHEMADGLAGRLAGGHGFDKTYDMYRTMKEVIDDIEVLNSEANLAQSTIDAWTKFKADQARIAPYYTK